MPSTLNPYLHFDGQAREAMEAYQAIFGGELTIDTYGRAGEVEGVRADHVMHSRLDTPQGWTLMAADVPAQMPLHVGNNVVVSLSGDEPELREHFARLAEGGRVTMPLVRHSWGDDFGELVDRFGIHWMVNVTGGTPAA